MIRFALRCANGHEFESWFRSAADFDNLKGAGELACSHCGDVDVAKAVMAPRVANSERPRVPAEADARAEAIARLRAEVEANSDYLGRDFAAEARRIHEGEVPRRSIWGEASPDEARALIDDGVRIAPLPFGPKRKMT